MMEELSISPVASPSRSATNSPAAPSYKDSQLDTIVRHQRRKSHKEPSTRRRGNRENKWFAGWGSIRHLDSLGVDNAVAGEDVGAGDGGAVTKIGEKKGESQDEGMGVWLGTGIAGVAVAGSPFYSFPAVIAVAGVFSPICLLVATLLLSFWRPVLNSLARSLPMSGANYIYFLNTTSAKFLVLFAAALTLLDDLATAVVSAGFAATYLFAQIDNFPIPISVLAILIMVGVGCLGLFGLQNGAGITCAILIFHMASMFSLFVAGVVEWGKQGNGVLVANWSAGQSQATTGGEIATRIFQGICIGFLGVTGFETTPDYISSLKSDPSIYPRLLRNLQYIAIAVNAPLLLVVFAVLPINSITSSTNSILNLLASTSSKPLAILITIDAVLILSAGVMTGIISAIALVEQMIEGQILPKFLGWKVRGGAIWMSLIGFVGVCVAIWASSGFDLGIVSQMFAITFLAVLLLYPISLLLLLINRPELSRHNSSYSSLPLILLTIALSIILLVGNIVIAPLSLLYFVAYVGVLFLAVSILANKGMLLIGLAWIFAELAGGGNGDTSRFGRKLVGAEKACLRRMEKIRGGDVVIFVKNDEISSLFRAIRYVEKTGDVVRRIKLVNIYDEIKRIPSELEANSKILDEAFPAITVDLIFVQGSFTPSLVKSISKKLEIPLALCFIMSAPNDLPSSPIPSFIATALTENDVELRGADEEAGNSSWSWKEFGGLRIIG